MGLSRNELLLLSMDELQQRARTRGLANVDELTREALVDALVEDEATRPPTTAESFLRRAKNLVKGVLERSRPPSVRPPARAEPPTREPLPTLTLAEIYLGQGHRDKALNVLRQVVQREPGNHEATRLLAQLETGEGARDPKAAAPVPATLRSEAADSSTTDDAAADEDEQDTDDDLPERYDVDEVVAIATDPSTVYLYWEVRPATLADARHQRPRGQLVIRIVAVRPHLDGPVAEQRDIPIDALFGDLFVRELLPGTNVRVSVGWRDGDAYAPFAVGLELTTPKTALTQVGPAVDRGVDEATAATAERARQRIRAQLELDQDGVPQADGATSDLPLTSGLSPQEIAVLRQTGGIVERVVPAEEEVVTWVERRGASELVRRRITRGGQTIERREWFWSGASELGRGASGLIRGSSALVRGASELARRA